MEYNDEPECKNIRRPTGDFFCCPPKGLGHEPVVERSSSLYPEGPKSGREGGNQPPILVPWHRTLGQSDTGI